MKKSELHQGRSYLNKSGRVERHILEIGTEVKVHWLGGSTREPVGEPGVRFVDTRIGKTFYGLGGGTSTRYLSCFATWAASEVPQGQEAPLYKTKGNTPSPCSFAQPVTVVDR